jgi:ribosomal protein L7/L12
MYNMYRCDVKCSFDEPRFVYWYSLYDGITKDKDGIITIPEASNPSSDYTVSTYMISGEAFTTEDRTHFYLGYETYEKLRDNHIRNEENVIYDDVDATEGDHFQGVFASLELTDKNGATLIGRNDYTNVGSVPVYHDGTYTITAKLADFGIEQTNIDGLSHFAIRFFSNLNQKDTFIDINNIDISDVHVVCDGKEVTFTPENVGAGFSPEDTIFWLFDDEMELTGKKAAVRSKGFAFSDTLEITFTVTGLPVIELPSNPAKNGGESTDAGNTTDNTVDEDPESVKNTDNTDVTDNTDNIDNTDTVDNTDNTDNVSENGEAAYKVVLESIGDDRTRIIKIVQDYTHMGLINARDLVDDVANGPKVVLQTDEKELAEEIKSVFEEYGAVAIIE